MAKKIENPLREEGLPSKIYLRAFSKPKSRYQIAREIYNTPPKQIPPTNKVTVQTKKLIALGYITKVNDGIISDVAPLIAEIEKDLGTQNIKLTTSEKEELITFLNDGLRELIPEMQFRDWNVPAYIALTQSIGWIVATQNIYSECNDPEFIQYLKDNFNFTEDEENFKNKVMKFPLSKNIRKKLQIYIPQELINLLPRLNLLETVIEQLNIFDEALQECLTPTDYEKLMEKMNEKMSKKKQLRE